MSDVQPAAGRAWNATLSLLIHFWVEGFVLDWNTFVCRSKADANL